MGTTTGRPTGPEIGPSTGHPGDSLVPDADADADVVMDRAFDLPAPPEQVWPWILDPPVLWEDADPAPPPTHLHSHWFSDPQTRPYAERLL